MGCIYLQAKINYWGNDFKTKGNFEINKLKAALYQNPSRKRLRKEIKECEFCSVAPQDATHQRSIR